MSLPRLTWPSVTLGDVRYLLGPAFTVAMLGAIESLLSATVADSMKAQPLQALKRAGLLEEFGHDNVVGDIDAALARAAQLVGAKT